MALAQLQSYAKPTIAFHGETTPKTRCRDVQARLHTCSLPDPLVPAVRGGDKAKEDAAVVRLCSDMPIDDLSLHPILHA